MEGVYWKVCSHKGELARVYWKGCIGRGAMTKANWQGRRDRGAVAWVQLLGCSASNAMIVFC